MKKILSKEEKDRITRRNQLILGLILIGLMILSTLGFAFSNNIAGNSQGKIEYNGIEFTQDNGYWKFSASGYEFLTLYNPEETKDIAFSGYVSLNNYMSKPLYFVSKKNSFSEIERNLAGRIALRVQEACIENGSCDKDLPVKNCKDDNIIVYKEVINNSDEKIYQKDNCIFIETQVSNVEKYEDAFLFNILGIN
ncbi:hypothetical protein J4221_01000 [Candidatus Pacearchaeota archaeon]|nr:hypothetical protein [Candidatus Pacearchaeota archaeon]